MKGKKKQHLSPGTRSRSCAQGGQEPSAEPHSLSLRADHAAAARMDGSGPPTLRSCSLSPAWAASHPQRHRRVAVPSPLCTQQASQSPLEMRHCPEPIHRKSLEARSRRTDHVKSQQASPSPFLTGGPGTAPRPSRVPDTHETKQGQTVQLTRTVNSHRTGERPVPGTLTPRPSDFTNDKFPPKFGGLFQQRIR